MTLMVSAQLIISGPQFAHAQEVSSALKQADTACRAGLSAFSQKNLEAAQADFEQVVRLAGGLRHARLARQPEYPRSEQRRRHIYRCQREAGVWTAVGTYGLSVAASDLDNDGLPDISVANDSAPATLYLNQ
jgi:hypothetical protein